MDYHTPKLKSKAHIKNFLNFQVLVFFNMPQNDHPAIDNEAEYNFIIVGGITGIKPEALLPLLLEDL